MSSMNFNPLARGLSARIAVIVPCLNEALAIGQTLDELKAALPEAALHVVDNNSTDETAAIARAPETGPVPRLPTAVLATGLMLCAMLALVCGAVLHTVTMGRREVKQFAYLRIPAPRAE